MDSIEYKKDYLENVKIASVTTGDGSCAAFVEIMAHQLIDADVLLDFTACYYTGRYGRNKYRVDGYVYDDFDNTMNLIIADFDGNNFERRLTTSAAMHDFGELNVFLKAALTSNLYREIEISTPCADLIDDLRNKEKDIRKFRFLIFTDAEKSSTIKNIVLKDYSGIPVEGQIWDIDRIYETFCSNEGRQTIEINFKEYCEKGIPCLEASSVATDQYRSYLGVIPGTVLADIYDKYGSKLLEGNVRSFLSTKVAVNKKIRATILSRPEMFFAFNNGISVTAKNVVIEKAKNGNFITSASDFQIINGGQTTASISNARYKDKADISELYVQMKLTAIDETVPEESDELIRNISRSSNSQNKVSDADFFASHPFHRRMEQYSRLLYAPATAGMQYETRWFYERARGQYMQEQIRMTPAKKKQFQLKHPKNQLIKKTDLAKVQNTWLGHPDVVSKGAQTNFNSFAQYIDDKWNSNEQQFNERYFQTTVALMIIFQYLERSIPKQTWYEGGYRANIIYYTVALLRVLIHEQFYGFDLDLILIWNRQSLPEQLSSTILRLAELVFQKITDPDRKIINVTQWCKRETCWSEVKKINFRLPKNLENCLITENDQKAAQRAANKDQNVFNGINAQSEVVGYPAEMWQRLENFTIKRRMVTATDVTALNVASQLPSKLPNSYQCKCLLKLLQKAMEEGFKTNN